MNYPSWLANVVLVKKNSEKWRLCIDFTDLNKACSKDYFPLPSINKLVDATAGYGYLTSLDALSGYYQIPIDPEDKDKITFIKEKGVYCYTAIPFELKNAGASY